MMSLMGMDDSGSNSGSAAAAATEVNHKQMLYEAHSKALGKSLKKGEDISYEVNEVGEGDERYQATVTIGGGAYAGDGARNHKQAEASAAKMALKDLYPASLQGVKRKGAPGAPAESNAKMQLNQACQ